MPRFLHTRVALELTKRPHKPGEMKAARDDALRELQHVEDVLVVAEEMARRFGEACRDRDAYKSALELIAARKNSTYVSPAHVPAEIAAEALGRAA